ncbi:uncharacterized protein LOC113495637 [Trichoplusia ni]|uniref:Uncharacterized protein LOC113495636 n=1 Tax=Trichoplusia ni TaxID=7111 RepID=A0A7E5VPQ7_TRINI|nr:uncharacterized protein LOC113495636 [Trichoplusia ni]XP_026730267.1 uncharacterized protein LOC113495637 [Trichoplusia ni]
MTSRITCFALHNVFGYTLKQGVVLVGFCSLLISVITLLASLIALCIMAATERQYNADPLNAIDMIFALFCTSTSMYQIGLAIMLLWYTVWHKGVPFFLTLWYGSHLSILPLYCFMFTARSLICFNAGYPVSGMMTIFFGIAFKGIYIYFAVIVNSYINSLEPNVIFF